MNVPKLHGTFSLSTKEAPQVPQISVLDSSGTWIPWTPPESQADRMPEIARPLTRENRKPLSPTLAVLWMWANLADFYTTEVGVRSGQLVELNPILAPLVGTPYFFLAKTLLPAGVLWWVWKHPRYKWVLVVGTIAMAIAAIWNWSLI